MMHPLIGTGIIITKDLDANYRSGDRAVIKEVDHWHSKPSDSHLDYRVERNGISKWIARKHFDFAVESEEAPAALPVAALEEIDRPFGQLSLFGEEATVS
ncbi:hypothetical protein [Tumebacillus lipolyticus]|uniref:Uncharacterized protein n=1 Tax=Tumebacillus lipolyticus TaxID=1280370 RepID=A0ABW5A2S8_9BACL